MRAFSSALLVGYLVLQGCSAASVSGGAETSAVPVVEDELLDNLAGLRASVMRLHELLHKIFIW